MCFPDVLHTIRPHCLIGITKQLKLMFAIFSRDKKLFRKTFLACTRCLFSESCFLQISYNCKHCYRKTFFVRITSVFFNSSRVGWSRIRFSNLRLKFRRCVWISNSDGKFPVQQTFGENLNESLYVTRLTIALIYRLKLKHSIKTSVFDCYKVGCKTGSKVVCCVSWIIRRFQLAMCSKKGSKYG